MKRMLAAAAIAVSSVVVSGCSGCGSGDSSTLPAATPAPAPAAAPSVEGYPGVAQPSGEWANKTNDLRRDLENIVAGRAGARADFEGDLEALIEGSEEFLNRKALAAVAAGVSEGQLAARLTPQQQARLVDLLFVATRKAAMDQAQTEALGNDVRQLLVSGGFPAPKAAAIGSNVASLAVSARPQQ